MTKLINRLPRFIRNLFPFSWRQEDWWDLDVALAEWMVPRLKDLRDNTTGIPVDFTEEEWTAILNEMIDGFSLVDSERFWLRDPATEYRVQRSYLLLAKHHMHLWD